MMKTLKCRHIPKIKFRSEESPPCKLSDRDNFEPMTDERWSEWSGEPIKVCLSPDIDATLLHASMKPTPVMIYAKEKYFIPFNEFARSKLVRAARVDLGINDKSKLIPIDERIKNFDIFEKNHFASSFDDAVHNFYRGERPQAGMTAYTEIKRYCLSSYGSLMIRRVIDEDLTPKFVIGVSDSYDYQAGGGFKANFIKLPKSFPSHEYFAISKQKIVGVAIIHHEFEHTKYGSVTNNDKDRSIFEEWQAVRFNENPVRIILGEDPRYVYYSNRSNKTINIITKQVKDGKWTFNKSDPSKLIEIK